MGQVAVKAAAQAVAETARAGGVQYKDAVQYTNRFQAVGNFVVILLGLTSSSGPDYSADFRELKSAISNLHNDMRREFRGIEALMVEHSFTKDIIHKVENQQRFLENLLSARSKEAVEQFKHECNRHRPQTLLSEIIGFIGHDTTNPMKFTMNANPFGSREIHGVWRKKIQNLAGTLAMLHGTFLGLNNQKDDGTMAANIRLLERTIAEFERTFKLNYWPELWALVEKTQDTRTDIGNGPKADIIRNKINNMYTNDQFYIIVYNDCQGYEKHSFRYHGDHAITRFGRGGCNIIIYRSKSAHSVNDATYEGFTRRLNNWKNDHIATRGDLRPVTNMIWDDMSAHYDTGFVGIIRARHEPAIRTTDERRRLPGAWVEAKCFIEKKTCPHNKAFNCPYKYPESHAYLIAGFT